MCKIAGIHPPSIHFVQAPKIKISHSHLQGENMKPLYYLILLLLCFVTIASAQNYLQNGGFESWTGSVPTGWITDSLYVAKSTTAHSGSAAAKLGNYIIFGTIAGPGELYQATPATGSSFSLKGWYQLKADSGDGFFVTITATKLGALEGAGEGKFNQAQSVYTAFAVGTEMLPNAATDTCLVEIMMLPGSSSKYHITANVLFDDLVLDNTVTGVRNDEFVRPSSYQLSQNYPNPFNPSTEIEFTIAKQQHVTLRVYNMLGQEIETLVDGQMPQGRYRKIFDGSHFASGTYLYVLQAGTFMQVRRMTMVK